MLHPALAQALVTAHVEDLQRAAARRHTIRLVSICRQAEGRPEAGNGAEVSASVSALPVERDDLMDSGSADCRTGPCL